MSAQLLGSVDSIKQDPVSVFYQSGYLTIKGYDPEFREYKLGFPNDEVQEGFVNCLMPFFTNQEKDTSQFAISRFVREVRSDQPEAFMTCLVAMIADTDYRIGVNFNSQQRCVDDWKIAY